MRIPLSLRFVLPLACLIALIAYGAMPLVDALAARWFVRDLDIRVGLITSAVSDSLIPLVESNARSKLDAFFDRVVKDERLNALGFCGTDGNLRYQSATFPKDLGCPRPAAISGSQGRITVMQLQDGPQHVAFEPIEDGGKRLGDLVLVHDMSFIRRRGQATKRFLFVFFAGLATAVSLLTVLVAHLSWKGWVSGIRALLNGEGILKPFSAAPELRPIAKDLRSLIRDLESVRKARDESQVSWSPRALKEILHSELAGDEILIVSNREPYIHVRRNDKIEVQVPASGLVTALEPIMRACSGTWIAHGSGSADREVVDKHDRVRVPPEAPSYQIRRVWLDKEEETGYYYGFANEGLWPLCHIAHTRPVFRTEDWNHYVAVNRKFADAVVEEAKTDDPVILVQDYHFALLPKMIKERLPHATIITFWHIPWPNPEAFGICPWREEILDGILGSSIIGFHTRFHCNNFFDTVDRYLESRIDRETSTISYGGSLTAVNHYPISIEYPVRWIKRQRPVKECRSQVRLRHGMPEDRLVGIGVDRLDYTKGILERFYAVERLLELEPRWIGKFSFLQIAAPTRSSIEQYQQFDAQVRALAARINRRFSREGYEPICLRIEHHEPDQVFEYFRAADLCFVSSLHDGMNLVGKEYVASRDDEQGVLILSQFTGAARELVEALIVNPYNIDQCAAALQMALEMTPEEQRNRMRSMRGLIQEFNVYRWAGKMLIDASRIRRRSRLFKKFQPKTLSSGIASIL
jgi:trehalose 6-phosphate synthase